MKLEGFGFLVVGSPEAVATMLADSVHRVPNLAITSTPRYCFEVSDLSADVAVSGKALGTNMQMIIGDLAAEANHAVAEPGPRFAHFLYHMQASNKPRKLSVSVEEAAFINQRSEQLATGTKKDNTQLWQTLVDYIAVQLRETAQAGIPLKGQKPLTHMLGVPIYATDFAGPEEFRAVFLQRLVELGRQALARDE